MPLATNRDLYDGSEPGRLHMVRLENHHAHPDWTQHHRSPDGGLEDYRMQLVARDGIPLFATVLCISFEEFYMDPKMTLVQNAIPVRGGV
jgi:hypothetical protein